MNRNLWMAVLCAAAVLALASWIPWQRLAGASEGGAPESATQVSPAAPAPPAGAPLENADAPRRPHVPEALVPGARWPRESRAAGFGASQSRGAAEIAGDDRALWMAAARGGVVASVLAIAVLIAAAWMRARGGPRRRALALAGRGVELPEVARRTGLSLDAVRALLAIGVAAPRRSAR